MKNKVALSIFMFALLAFLCVNKAFSCTYGNPESKCESSFAKMVDDKHYLKPGSIVFSAEGLFLLIQGHLVPINSVETDAQGVFIRSAEYPYGTCPNCNYPLTPGGTCLNARCPLSPLYDPDYD